MATESYVLDACTLIAFFNDEPGAEKMNDLLERADRNEAVLQMHAVNLYEVYYYILRSGDEAETSSLLADVGEMPVEICRRCPDNLLENTAFFKVHEKVSLADSFALGFAKIENSCLVSTDHHEFDVIDQKNLAPFYWLR